MKTILILLFFVLSSTVWSKSLPFYPAHKIVKWGINKKTDLYLSYVQFFIKQEKDELWKNIDATSKVVFLQQLERALLNSAQAKLNGEFCFFGGWKSQVADHVYCKRPWDSHPKNYKNSTCKEYEFQCNPTLFGKSCIIPFADYHDVTKMCWQQFNKNNLIKDFLRNKKWKDFEIIEKEVNTFCQQNTFKEQGKTHYSYDACDVLNKHLKKIKAELSKHSTSVKDKKVPPSTSKKDPSDRSADGISASDDVTKKLKQVVETTEVTTEIIETIISIKDKDCDCNDKGNITNCSKSLFERSRKTYSKGIGGYLLFQDTPQDKCQDKMDIPHVDLAKLDAFLRGIPAFDAPAKSFYSAGNMCLKQLDDTLNRKQAKLAKTYMLIDFYEKQARLAKGTKALLQGIAEINTMLGEKAIGKDQRCNSTIVTVDKQCEAFKLCPAQKAKELFQNKRDASRAAWQELEMLQQKKKELHSLALQRNLSSRYAKRKLQELNISGRSGIKKLRSLIQARIDEIKNSYPWLDSSTLRKKTSKQVSDDQLGKQMTSFYQQQKSKLQKLYNDNVRAYSCLFDEDNVNYSKDCRDVDLIVKRNPSLDTQGLAKNNQVFQSALNFYSCAEDQRHLNKEQIKMVSDYAIMAGLTFIPFGLGHLGRAAIWGGRLLLAADSAYMANTVKEVVQQCRQNNNRIQQVGKDGQLRCQDFTDSAQLIAKQESCLKAGATSASIALLPYMGYGLSRFVQRGVKTGAMATVKQVSYSAPKRLPSPTSKAMVKRGTKVLRRSHIPRTGEIIDVEIIPTAKKLPTTQQVKLLPAPRKALPVSSSLNSVSKVPRSGDFAKLLKKFQINKMKFYRGQLTAKKKEQLALGILKKFNITVSKGPQRNREIYNKLQQLLKDLKKQAAQATTADRLYYQKLIRNIKRINYQRYSAKVKVLLPRPRNTAAAKKSFQEILDSLHINQLVYRKKNLSPKNRSRLINAIIKREGVTLRGGGHHGRSTKVKIKRTLKIFRERKSQANSAQEKSYWAEWIKYLEQL